MFYQGTLTALRAEVETIRPGTVSAYSELQPGKVAPLSYLLWMCNEVQKMDITSIDESVKAGRWIGWITAHIELSGIWNNSKTRDLVREDRRKGFDKPHLE